jgi:hypothetical protein
MTSELSPIEGYTIFDPIEASAEIVQRTRSLCFVRGQVTSSGKTLLNASCIYKRLREFSETSTA